MDIKNTETTRLADGSSFDNGLRYARIPIACQLYGLSRSGIYRLAADGHIRLVKLGGSTLVDCNSIRAFMAALPAASVRAPSPSKRAGGL